MWKTVTTQDVQRIPAGGGQIVDALPKNEYDRAHIPGAINLPLRELNADSACALRRDRPIVTYCNDHE